MHEPASLDYCQTCGDFRGTFDWYTPPLMSCSACKQAWLDGDFPQPAITNSHEPATIVKVGRVDDRFNGTARG